MIQTREERESNVFGYSQQSNITISESSMDYIIELLSSNLYTEPINSFLRENISNAWDANVENNKTDEPILVDINEEYQYVQISDNGIGISPQRFQDIYLKLGSSTKRDNNQQIGSFGLGRLSSLACSNNVFVDTIYYDDNTQKYIRDVYNMYKPNVGINIENIIHEEFDDIQNTGTKVRVYLNYLYGDASSMINSIQSTFPILYINNHIKVTTTNDYLKRDLDIKIPYTEYQHFYIMDMNDMHNQHNNIMIGNLLYKDINIPSFTIDELLKPNENNYYNTCIHSLKVIPKLNIGDIDFTPSRDNVKYNQKTIDNIQKAYNNTVKELLTFNTIHYIKDLSFLHDDASILKRLLLYTKLALIDTPKICREDLKEKYTFKIKMSNISSMLPLRRFKCITCNIDPNAEGKPLIMILDIISIAEYVITQGAKLVLTNRIMNDLFRKEKESITEPTIFVPYLPYIKYYNTEERKKVHTLINELAKYTDPGTIKYESKKKYGSIRQRTKRSSSETFKMQFVNESENYSSDTYSTKLDTEYIRIEDTEDYPIIVTDKLNQNAVTLLRYLFRFYIELDDEYKYKLFPKELRFAACSPSTVTKLTTKGKAIDMFNYLNSDNVAVNIIKLVNNKRYIWRHIGKLSSDIRTFLKAKTNDCKTVNNLNMIIQIINTARRIDNKDVEEYLGKDINYSKFGKTLILLKDLIYNYTILDEKRENLNKYFIPRYSNFERTYYGK